MTLRADPKSDHHSLQMRLATSAGGGACVMTKSLARERGPAKPRLLSVEDAARMLGLGLSSVYNLRTRGDLDAIKMGDRPLIKVESVDKFIAPRPPAKIAPPRPKRGRRRS